MHDFLPIAALAVSLFSLLVAMRRGTMEERVKGAELRSQILLKYKELKIEALTFKQYLNQIKAEAVRANDDELLKLVDHEKTLNKCIADYDEDCEKIAKLPAEAGIAIFDKGFDYINGLIGDLRGLRKQAEMEVEDQIRRRTRCDV